MRFCLIGFVLSFNLLSVAFAQLVPSVKPQAAQSPERVLFVGNSYIYYNNSLHNHVADLVRAADPELGTRLRFKSSTIGGSALHHHNVAHLTEVGRIGVPQAFEWVVLQGGSGEPLSRTRRQTFLTVAKVYADLIKARGGQVALF